MIFTSEINSIKGSVLLIKLLLQSDINIYHLLAFPWGALTWLKSLLLLVYLEISPSLEATWT